MKNQKLEPLQQSTGDLAFVKESERSQLYRSAYSKIVRLRTINVMPSDTNLRTPQQTTQTSDETPLREHFQRHNLQRLETYDQVCQEELNNFQIYWNWIYFFEFLLYHIVFYILLGPLMVIVFWKKPGMPLLINMRFIKHHAQFYFQLLLWMGSAVGGLFYFCFQDSIITMTEIIFMWFALLIRAVVISAKYATLSPERIKLYKQQVLSEEMFTFDLMMWDWRLQTPKVLFIEQLRYLKRRELDIGSYRLDFLINPSQKSIIGIEKAEVGFYQDWIQRQEDLEIDPISEDNTFNGFHVMAYLVSLFQKEHNSNSFSKYVVVQALILSLSPCFLRIQYFMEIQIDWLDIVRLVVNILTSFQAFFGAFVFLQIGLYDLQRKFFLLDQCLYMLSTKKVSYSSSKKWLPTINFNNPSALQAWSILRSLCFEYGKTYDLRIQGFYSLIFIGWMVLFICFLILILDLIAIEQFSLILFLEMFAILTGFIGYYLYHGARLNSYYEKFNISLEDVMTMYIDIRRKKEKYFIHKLIPSNCIHQRFVNLISKQTDDIESVKEYIEFIIDQIEDIMRQLQYDEKHHPFKIYGVVITYNVLKSVIVALSTLLGYAIQQRFSNSDINCIF